MAPVPKKTIDHFTHPQHELVESNSGSDYICDGCRIIGTGNRFSCGPCQFDLHEYCATCPPTVSSFAHPPHPLYIVVRKPAQVRRTYRSCDICREEIDGLFYHCKDCNFDLHPLCTLVPETLTHWPGTGHRLVLEFAADESLCDICGDGCDGFRYRCRDCKVDIHPACSSEWRDPPLPRQEPPNTPPAAPREATPSAPREAAADRVQRERGQRRRRFNSFLQQVWTGLFTNALYDQMTGGGN